MKHDKVTIAIVIPNYNDVETLPRSIQSAINQVPKPDEIIIVDDCSTDTSFEVANKFKNDCKEVRLIRNRENIGVMKTLNIGLNEVVSDYVLFLSANDYLLNGIVQSAKNSLREKKIGIWSALIFKEKKSPYPSPVVLKKGGYIPPERCIVNLNRVGSWFTGTTMFLNVKALKELGGFNDKLHGFADMYAAMIISAKYGAFFEPHPYGVATAHPGGLLEGTLLKRGILESSIKLMVEDGLIKCPKLFTNSYINKHTKRLEFSAGKARLKAGRFRVVQAILLFIKLRLAEVIPFIYYRYCVRLRGSRGEL
ncbi:MAG: hypothetical protein RLZZ196_247 [Bacteroidota bacterium]|jgi:glycosyltransferase involved in cell wall biosynthesis